MWFTLQQKVELYKISKEHPHWTQDDLASWFQRTYHSLKKPSQTTISRVLKSGEDMIAKLEANERAIQNGETPPKKPRKKSSPSIATTTNTTTASVKKRKSTVKTDINEKLKKQKTKEDTLAIKQQQQQQQQQLLPQQQEIQKPYIATTTTNNLTKKIKPSSSTSSYNNNNSNSTSKRNLQNQLLRKILQEWIYQTSWNNIPITFPILKDTAASIWQKLPLETRNGNGFFTYKWLVKFLERCNIEPPSSSKNCIELSKAKKIWSFEERDLLKSFLMQIPKQDLFTLDETLFAYNLPLDKTYYGISKLKRQIEIMTIMFCVNVDASEKLDPLCIGKYANYQCFKEDFGDRSNVGNVDLYSQDISAKYGIEYHSNQESFLTSTIFHNWLINWDNKLRVVNRQIYIILDDCCSHRIMNVKLTNITLIYTRAQNKFLPFNWGIIDEFKTKYRQQQYEALIDLQKNITRINGSPKKEILTFQQSKINICNAFKLIKRSWDSISEASLMTSWKASGILPANSITLNKPISMGLKKSDIFLKILQRLQSEFRTFSKWDAEMLLDLSIEHRSLNFVSLQELIDFATVIPWEPIYDEITLEQANNIITGSNQGSILNSGSQQPFGREMVSNTIFNGQTNDKFMSMSPFNNNNKNSILPYTLSPLHVRNTVEPLISGDASSIDQLDFQSEALDQEVLAILNMTNFERQSINHKQINSNNLLNIDNNASSNPESVESNSLLQFTDLHNAVTTNLQKGELNINNKTGVTPDFIKHANLNADGEELESEQDEGEKQKENKNLESEEEEEEDDDDDEEFGDEEDDDDDGDDEERITARELAENKQIRSGIPILNNMANSPEFLNNNSMSSYRPRRDSIMQMFEYNGLDEFRQQLGGIGGYGAKLQQEQIEQASFTPQQPLLAQPQPQSNGIQIQQNNTPLSNHANSPLLAEFQILQQLQKQEQARKLLILLNDIVSYQNQPLILKSVKIKMSIDLQLELSKIYNEILFFLKTDALKENYFCNVEPLLLPNDISVEMLTADATSIKKLIAQFQELTSYCKLPQVAQIFPIQPIKSLNELETIMGLLLQILKRCI